VDLATIHQLNSIACGGLRPDLTVLLDLPVAEGLARGAAGNADRFGREEEAFHERVRRGYLALAAGEPERWLLIDARQAPEAVTEAIWPRVAALL
jgi:dTMP kinase